LNTLGDVSIDYVCVDSAGKRPEAHLLYVLILWPKVPMT